jgi:predicted TIM-barrel fold metal-dependent hydrolase
MKLFDVHSHWGTERGYPLRTDESRALQKKKWNSTTQYHTEDEMAAYLRKNDVRTILDFGFTKNIPLAETVAYHDYAIETQKKYPDCIHGFWVQLNPATGREGAEELKRCMQRSKGFVSYCVTGAGMGYPACDPIFAPFYEACLERDLPVLVMVGYTGNGGGLRGGGGIELDLSHPRHIDKLAIMYPDMKIISSRPAWPWQDDMIAVMLHKPNVWAEMHGWSPKYFTDPLKREIRTRFKDRVMFGADYPLFQYERLVADWQSLGYDEAILEKVFWKNAEQLFGANVAAEKSA